MEEETGVARVIECNTLQAEPVGEESMSELRGHGNDLDGKHPLVKGI